MEHWNHNASIVINIALIDSLIKAFFRLRGSLPFDANDVESILEATIREPLILEGRFWSNVSPEAQDLLYRFLEKDPKNRISLQDALNHPWIKVIRARSIISYDYHEI